jgi:hypothetical protein
MEDKGVTFGRERFTFVIMNGSFCVQRYHQQQNHKDSDSDRRHFGETKELWICGNDLLFCVNLEM